MAKIIARCATEVSHCSNFNDTKIEGRLAEWSSLWERDNSELRKATALEKFARLSELVSDFVVLELLLLLLLFAKNSDLKKEKDGPSLWLAPSLSRRWGELFFLAYSPFWIVLCLGVVVPLQLYEKFQELEYLILGLVCAVPTFILPIFFVGKEDAKKAWYKRYWVKANIWVFIFGGVGNYFWTHYFYTVLGATYSFPSYKLNHVPLTTFLLTHSYFLFYHMISNFTIRRLRYATAGIQSAIVRILIEAVWIFVLSFVTAFMEALTIANFPYYEMVDRGAMYKFGSLFYAIYFFVSFPMFFRLDANPQRLWTLSQTAIDSLAAAMLVTILLDLWRIAIGPIVDIPWGASLEQCASFGLPWLQDTSKKLPTVRVRVEATGTNVY